MSLVKSSNGLLRMVYITEWTNKCSSIINKSKWSKRVCRVIGLGLKVTKAWWEIKGGGWVWVWVVISLVSWSMCGKISRGPVCCITGVCNVSRRRIS